MVEEIQQKALPLTSSLWLQQLAKDNALKQLQPRQRRKLTFVKKEKDKRNVGDKEESETKMKSLSLSDYKGKGVQR
ncbi:hypothetical protein IHE44_0008225 [Lamprotornis superbus]|uniref:Uncharacterized protein n=1 Tax=Lamprotornis superbus TaxID=245042 RepID=A0A835NQI8_9PASS|nr:hypothetical protein IHE44_0008225 [Lamprotornis superbus]